jgi:hypothetical protein
MRQSIHHHYEKLNDSEHDFVDWVFADVHDKARKAGIPLAGNDILERAVDAFARAVIESRKG